MTYPPPRKDKAPGNGNEKHSSLAVRLNRAANEINPFLIVVAVGLLILNLTFYLGMSVSRHPVVPAASQSTGYSAPDAPSSAPQIASRH